MPGLGWDASGFGRQRNSVKKQDNRKLLHGRQMLLLMLFACAPEFESKNFPPSIEIISPENGALFNENQGIPFSMKLVDTEQRPENISVHWESDIDGFISIERTNSAGLQSFNYSHLSPGKHNIVVRATDSQGAFTNEEVQILVNDLPSSPLISFASNVV